ncbi:ABC transporter ATP-binding protein [Janibacter corallicola]|uniref:ABC transporter ATP-binding protein n=1 Tax=Janibacter corallicola TaxID=415212 RepID=UPI000A02252C|nr:ATP-binding cassette domain-containing protein [Janibacter corallicola]
MSRRHGGGGRRGRSAPLQQAPSGPLVASGLGVTYDDVVALSDIACTAQPGEVTAVTGHSGAGKTSLLWAVGGLLAHGQRTGTVTVGGHAIDSEADARAVGSVLIPQGSALAAILSAEDNVAVPLVAAGASGDEALARSHSALTSVGLEDHTSHLAEELSGGQRQRVAVARGLALAEQHLERGGAAVLLADEPTSELDHDTRERVVALLHAMARRGAVVLMSTHDPEVAETADAGVHLDDGSLG